jgi:hypothetical protein
MIRCVKCNIEKENREYKFRENTQKYSGRCRSCDKKYYEEYYKKNKKIILDRSNQYYKENTEEKLEYSKKYRENNDDKIKKWRVGYLEKNAQKNRDRVREWRKENKEKRNLNDKNRRKVDSLFKLTQYVRNRTMFYLKKMNIDKENKTFEIVGCSPEFLKEHIEKQFSEGMSWDLMGKHIHIDHIKPLSSAKTEGELYKLCHYTNLQPLWAEENLRKSNKILITN